MGHDRRVRVQASVCVDRGLPLGLAVLEGGGIVELDALKAIVVDVDSNGVTIFDQCYRSSEDRLRADVADHEANRPS